MIIYWGSNIAGKTRDQAFMIKGQDFLNGYVSSPSATIVPIDILTFDSYITLTENFDSHIETSKDFDSHIETVLTFKSEVN